MKLNDLLEKDITIEYINGETNSSITGKLVEIDDVLKVVHVHTYYNRKDHLIPLYSVLSISERF